MPELARREAPRLLGAIAAGDDPLVDRKAEARTMTLAALCELYLAEGVGYKKKRMAAFLICCRSSTPRGRRSFGFSMQCIVGTDRAMSAPPRNRRRRAQGARAEVVRSICAGSEARANLL